MKHAVVRYHNQFHRSKSLREGPRLPEAMNFPCIVEIIAFNVIFIMGKSTQSSDMSSYLYFVQNDTWVDTNFPCHMMNDAHTSYSCAILSLNYVIISIVRSDGYIRTAYYNIKLFTWNDTKNNINAGNIIAVTLLRSEDKKYVTLLASQPKSNITLVYQVS